MLAKHGEFFPFAATMDNAGNVAHVGADTGEEQPKSQDVIDFLTAALREQAKTGEIRAAGICLDVRIVPPGQTEKTDAVCARLEHLSGEAVDVFLPYKRGADGKVAYSDLLAAKGRQANFGEAASAE